MEKQASNLSTKYTSKNMQFLKSSNRAAVIRALALKKASSRTELALYLNLTRMTISNIVNELRDEAFIQESEPGNSCSNPPSNGRPAKRLTLTDWTITSICIHIRRYSVSCMLMDLKGNTDFHSSSSLPEDADNRLLMNILFAQIQEIVDKASGIPIIGIGIASIGPLDIYKKHLLNPPDFRNIRDLDIGGPLEARFHLPVYMDNDMNCSSLAELFFGNGISRRDLVFLGFSSGVGAGIIMNEKIIHGFGGFAGEVGHISINPLGPLCPCGQHGCIELYTRGEHILKNVGLKTFQELNQILDEEEPPRFILNCMKEYLDAMHSLVVAIANSYDPDILILGDIDPVFMNRFIPELEEYMNSHMLNQGYKHIRIMPSAIGTKAPLYGAGSIVFQRIFDCELILTPPENMLRK